MKFFGIIVVDNEYKLYDIRGGTVFFILKEKFGKYHTSQLFHYEPIVEEMKLWLLSVIEKNPNKFEDLSFNHDDVIEPMFKQTRRQNKLEELGI